MDLNAEVFLDKNSVCVCSSIVATSCTKVLAQVECCELFLHITWFILVMIYVLLDISFFTSTKSPYMQCYIGMLKKMALKVILFFE